jgi:hypothetical protein
MSAADKFFTRSRFYLQDPWLTFTSSRVEKQFSLDSSRLAENCSENTAVFIVALALQLSLSSNCYWFSMTGSVIALLLIAGLKSPRNQLVTTGALAMMPILWNSLVSSEEALTAMLPTFAFYGVILKDWKRCTGGLALTAAVSLSYHDASFMHIVASAALLSLLSSVIERDARSLWVLMDCYKRAYLEYFDLFSKGADAVLITDVSTKVICTNSKAALLLSSLHSGISNSPVKFSSLAKDCGVSSVKSAALACAKGETMELGFSFERRVGEKLESLGTYWAKVEPVSWRQTDCIKFSLTSLEGVDRQRQVVLSQTKDILSRLKATHTQLEFAYESCKLLKPTDLYQIQSLTFSLSSILTFQQISRGSVEAQITNFVLQREIVKQIESSAHLALLRDIEIEFHHDAALPQVVVGDAEKTSIVVQTIIEFAAKVGRVKSIIQVRCELKVSCYAECYKQRHPDYPEVSLRASSNDP